MIALSARLSRGWIALSLIGAVLATGCAASAAPQPAQQGVIHPEIWPRGASPIQRDAAIEARIAALMARMSVEEKVGQIIQGDMNSTTPEDVRRYRLGSILNGGNSGPNGNDRARAAQWLAAADAYYDASMDASSGRPAIPVLWGSDAVHGNANIIGATIFPHNIGLGAARDPALLRRIGVLARLCRAVGAVGRSRPSRRRAPSGA